MKRLIRIFTGNFSVDIKKNIDPDEIFLDAANLPEFDRHKLQGRLEKPIQKKILFFLGFAYCTVLSFFVFQAFLLQVERGEAYVKRGEDNRLRHNIVFASRGVVNDRRGTPLIWNEPAENENDFPRRQYISADGFGHLLGYVSIPARDSAGFFYQTDFIGKAGVEDSLNSDLSGINGVKLIETDAFGNITSQSTLNLPKNGTEIYLSIDARIQEKFFEYIKKLSVDVGFLGGAGIIMDVETGEIIAMVSFPEYVSQIMSDGDDEDLIKKYFEDKRTVFLNRAVSGLYTPGSIVKPFVALGALEEGIIQPLKEILSTGSISIPNPYDKDNPTIFKDWKAHGYVDMRRALAVSSDVYFYEIGGGFEDQIGLGIAKIEKYFRMFGFGMQTGFSFDFEKEGVIPNPKWKEENFDGDPWRVGNTYHTAIGQYGMQVSPIQVVRAVAAIGNGGKLVIPTIKKSKDGVVGGGSQISFSEENLRVIKEGMKVAVEEGTAIGLNNMYVDVAAKTGTAELGISKQYVHSWVTGFFPYERPRYAFVVLMEKGPRSNLVGGTFVMRQLLDWMNENTPEYFE